MPALPRGNLCRFDAFDAFLASSKYWNLDVTADLQPTRGDGWLSYRWELIGLLWFAYFFNQADRNVYNVVLRDLSADLQLSPEQAGLIGSIFMWSYAAMVPVAGYVGDVLRRKWIVCGSLLLWSIATLLSGASGGLVGLIVFRGLATGGGEAFYYPAANSLIGQYHQKSRALAMSIHQTSLYAGVIVSGIAAGALAQYFGWRSSFYVFGTFGVVLAMILMLRIRDVGPADAGDQPPKLPLGEVLHAVGHKPTVWLLCIAFALFNFAGWGYLTWMPTFLQERFNQDQKAAGFNALFYTNVAALLGVLVAGRLSDVWAARRRTFRLEVQCLGLVLGAPCIWLMAQADRPWLCYVGLAGFGLCRGVYDSNLFATLFDVIEPRYRSSAVGTMLAAAFAASGLAPVTLGYAKSWIGLADAIAWLSAAFLAAAVVLLAASRWTLGRDFCAIEPGNGDAVRGN